jgi:hypothetical protein
MRTTEVDAMSATKHESLGGVTIRRLGAGDADALRRLAQLDGQSGATAGEWLGAEVEGRLLAAVGLDGGTSLADPFSRSGELRELLELRVRQLNGRSRGARRRRFARRRASLAPSPPGAGGQLVTLPLRPY